MWSSHAPPQPGAADHNPYSNIAARLYPLEGIHQKFDSKDFVILVTPASSPLTFTVRFLETKASAQRHGGAWLGGVQLVPTNGGRGSKNTLTPTIDVASAPDCEACKIRGLYRATGDYNSQLDFTHEAGPTEAWVATVDLRHDFFSRLPYGETFAYALRVKAVREGYTHQGAPQVYSEIFYVSRRHVPSPVGDSGVVERTDSDGGYAALLPKHLDR